jgi:hypothetical protein
MDIKGHTVHTVLIAQDSSVLGRTKPVQPKLDDLYLFAFSPPRPGLALCTSSWRPLANGQFCVVNPAEEH